MCGMDLLAWIFRKWKRSPKWPDAMAMDRIGSLARATPDYDFWAHNGQDLPAHALMDWAVGHAANGRCGARVDRIDVFCRNIRHRLRTTCC
jgi:hypothetical protein